jgi:hypothetical protein
MIGGVMMVMKMTLVKGFPGRLISIIGITQGDQRLGGSGMRRNMDIPVCKKNISLGERGVRLAKNVDRGIIHVSIGNKTMCGHYVETWHNPSRWIKYSLTNGFHVNCKVCKAGLKKEFKSRIKDLEHCQKRVDSWSMVRNYLKP